MTYLVNNLLHAPSSYGSSRLSDHVILSFNIIVKYIKYFRGVYLHFKHDVIAAQTVVENYIILPNVFRKTDDFGGASSVGQMYADLLEQRLGYRAYLPSFTKGIVIGIFIYPRNRYYQGMC